MSNSKENKWIKKISGYNEKVKLFCFPHAGAGAYVYSGWKDTLSKEIGLYAVLLPGREKRIREPLVSDVKTICMSVAENIKDELDSPYVLFGHSMGGILVYETLKQIMKKKLPLPKCIIMSATSLKGFKDIPDIDRYDDDELAKYLYEMGGTSKELLDNDGFRDCFFPIIRNDYKLVREYKGTLINVPVPIVAMYGSEDKYVDRDKLSSLHHLTEKFKMIDIKGGHFFIEDTGMMCSTLDRIVLS